MKILILSLLLSLPSFIRAEEETELLKGMRLGCEKLKVALGCHNYANLLLNRNDQEGAQKYFKLGCESGHAPSCQQEAWQPNAGAAVVVELPKSREEMGPAIVETTQVASAPVVEEPPVAEMTQETPILEATPSPTGEMETPPIQAAASETPDPLSTPALPEEAVAPAPSEPIAAVAESSAVSSDPMAPAAEPLREVANQEKAQPSVSTPDESLLTEPTPQESTAINSPTPALLE